MRDLSVITIVFFLSAVSSLEAQLQIGVNLNIASRPAPEPAGYEYVEYYYMPDIEVYYNVSLDRYYYFEGGRWVWSVELPQRYHDYDLYHSYKVVVNEDQPWLKHEIYRERYAPSRSHRNQVIIHGRFETR